MAMEPFLRVPTLTQQQPIVEESRRPTSAFLRTMNDIIQRIVQVVNAIVDVLDIQEQLQAAVTAAQEAAQDARDAADNAQAQADATKREAALVSSYIDPDGVVSATPTVVSIAAHTRYYADGTSVAVNAGTGEATAEAEVDYVSYEDPMRAGGAVTYIISTTPPVQTGETHVVGAVQIPATGTNEGGSGPQRPGQVYPNKFANEPDA